VTSNYCSTGQYSPTTTTIEHTETYRGHPFIVERRVTVSSCRYASDPGHTCKGMYEHGEHTHSTLDLSLGGYVDSIEHGVKRAHQIIDRRISDDEVRPAVMTAMASTRDPSSLIVPAALPSVGCRAWVHGTGQWRRGVVVNVTRTRVTIAYTTPSSQGGIFRKAARLDQIRQDA
jgi:hypothetical protein